MIYSLTIAPAIDYSLNRGDKEIKIDATNRPTSDGYSVGGKGITVSRRLKNLRVKNTPIVAVGGGMGKRLKNIIDKEFDKIIYLSVIGETRLDVRITGPHTDTRFNPSAPKVTEKGRQKRYAYLKKNLKKGDIVILSGSVGQERKDLYAELRKDIIEPSGALTIVDTTGESLTSVFPYHPFRIKPNDEELGDLLGRERKTDEDILEGGRELKKKGPVSVLVTRGSKGAYYFAED